MVDHQDVEPPERAHRTLNERAAIRRRGQILPDRKAAVAAPAFGRQGFGTFPRLPIAEGHSRAGHRKQAHGLRTDAPRTAGDEGSFVFENEGNSHHRLTLKAASRRSKARQGRSIHLKESWLRSGREDAVDSSAPQRGGTCADRSWA